VSKKLLGGVLVASLVFAAAAQAVNYHLGGTTDGGGKIGMTVRGHGPFTVTNLKFSGVRITCNRGKFTVAMDTTPHEFTVDSVGRFREALPLGGSAYGKLKIKGKLNGFSHGHGGLRLKGGGIQVEERQKPQNGCDTGRVLWTAATSS
jgi:hypothetical protein